MTRTPTDNLIASWNSPLLDEMETPSTPYEMLLRSCGEAARWKRQAIVLFVCLVVALGAVIVFAAREWAR